MRAPHLVQARPPRPQQRGQRLELAAQLQQLGLVEAAGGRAAGETIEKWESGGRAGGNMPGSYENTGQGEQGMPRVGPLALMRPAQELWVWRRRGREHGHGHAQGAMGWYDNVRAAIGWRACMQARTAKGAQGRKQSGGEGPPGHPGARVKVRAGIALWASWNSCSCMPPVHSMPPAGPARHAYPGPKMRPNSSPSASSATS